MKGSTLSTIIEHRFSKLLRDTELQKKKISTINEGMRVKCGYAFDLIWWIKERRHPKWPVIDARIRASYPKKVQEWEQDETEWTEGFACGLLALSQLVFDVLNAEEYVANFYVKPNPDDLFDCIEDHIIDAFPFPNENPYYNHREDVDKYCGNLDRQVERTFIQGENQSIVISELLPSGFAARQSSAEFHGRVLAWGSLDIFGDFNVSFSTPWQEVRCHHRVFDGRRLKAKRPSLIVGDEGVLSTLTPSLIHRRFNRAMREFYFINQKLILIENLVQILDDYAHDLVMYARTSDEARRTYPKVDAWMTEVERKYPDQIQDLDSWQHGCNSGYMAFSRMILGILGAEKEEAEWQRLNPDEPITGDDVEQRMQSAVDDFPMLDG